MSTLIRSAVIAALVVLGTAAPRLDARAPVSAGRWRFVVDRMAGFRIRCPRDLKTSPRKPMDPFTSADAPGRSFVFPRSYGAGTDLLDASLTVVSMMGGKEAAAQKLPSGSPPTRVRIAGRTWLFATGGDAGAGQIYRQWVYSTVADHRCYRVFLTTHSTHVDPYNTRPEFDPKPLTRVLRQIVSSFEPLVGSRPRAVATVAES